MNEVEFHTGVADPVAFACRLLRKASRQGTRVLVMAPPPLLAELDTALWTFEEREFLPHVRMPGARPGLATRTPVWLSADGEGLGLPGAPRLVVNLGADAPSEPAPLERLIEVVSSEPEDADRGRQRWRAYKTAGLQIKHHVAGGGRDG